MQYFKIVPGLLLLLTLGACASTSPSLGTVAMQTRMPEGVDVAAPFGFEAMCDRRAELCGEIRNAGATPVAATDGPSSPSPAPIVLQSGDLRVLVKGDSDVPATPARAPAVAVSDVATTPAAAMGVEAVAETGPSGNGVNDHAWAEAAGDRAAPIDPETAFALLNAVNRRVNTLVRQTDDPALVGDPDQWQPPARTASGVYGDCKRIAVEKRRLLEGQGYPPQDLIYALVYRRDIGMHVVLIARTGRGDLVLDSRSPWVTAWTDAPYQWVKRQSDEDPRRWVMVAEKPHSEAKLYLAQNEPTSLHR